LGRRKKGKNRVSKIDGQREREKENKDREKEFEKVLAKNDRTEKGKG
jgi:hypothetical protein